MTYYVNKFSFFYKLNALDNPKSQIFISQFSFSKILLGLISLCIILAECIKYMAFNN